MNLNAKRSGGVTLFASLCLLSLAGCGSGEPKTVPISGKVVYSNGKPLTNGMIIFNPSQGDDAAPLAMIQSDGTFTFTEVGVLPGEYIVSLAQSEGGEPPVVADGEEESATIVFNVPEKYLEPDTSGWTASVKESGNEPFTFTISSGKKK